MRDLSFKYVFVHEEAGGMSLLVNKQELNSDASFSSVTVELKYVKNIIVKYWALDLSLTKRAHDVYLEQEE